MESGVPNEPKIRTTNSKTHRHINVIPKIEKKALHKCTDSENPKNLVPQTAKSKALFVWVAESNQAPKTHMGCIQRSSCAFLDLQKVGRMHSYCCFVCGGYYMKTLMIQSM